MTKWMSKLTLIALAIPGLFIVSCGEAEDYGKDLAVSVTPSKVPILPGDVSSCKDEADAKTSGESAARSIKANWVRFNKFRLQWKGVDPLYVVMIRVTIDHPSITGSPFILTTDEIEALLGVESAIVPKTTDIDSTSTSKGAAFAPCGLSIGGITVAKDASSFTASAQIEVIGYSYSEENGQKLVKQTIDAEVEVP